MAITVSFGLSRGYARLTPATQQPESEAAIPEASPSCELPGVWGETVTEARTENQFSPQPAAAAPAPIQFLSFPLRVCTALGRAVHLGLGIASLWFLLAVAAAIPIVQFASFGYLLAASGQVAISGRLRDGLLGWRKAAQLGGILLGGWLSLLPVRLWSDAWYAAWLIDPESGQTKFLRVGLLGLVVLTGVHVLAALACGGKLRHFLWPVVAPLQWFVWLGQGLIRWPIARELVDGSVGRLFPRLVADLRGLRPLADWFPPFVLAKSIRRGKWLSRCAAQLWSFWVGLRLSDCWWLGFRGAVGTLLWLLVPSILLIAAANRNDELGGLLALGGIPLAAVVFALLLQVQVRFATTRRWRAFIEPRAAWEQFRRAPLWLAIFGWAALVLALPMFLLKIEAVPAELEPALSLAFVAGAWPARLLLGWATARGNRREQVRPWWWSYPCFAVLLIGCGAFAVILVLTRYLSWSGAGSLLENHLFLLPTPFWLS